MLAPLALIDALISSLRASAAAAAAASVSLPSPRIAVASLMNRLTDSFH